MCVWVGERERKGEKKSVKQRSRTVGKQESVAPASDSSIFNDALVSSCTAAAASPPLYTLYSETHKPSQL